MNRYVIELIVLGAVWGLSFIFLRIAVPALGASVTTFGRLALAVILLMGIATALRTRFPWHTHRKKIIAYGLLNTGAPFLLFGLASKYLPAGYLAVLNGTAALFSVVVAIVWLKQKITAHKIIGMGLGLIGIVVLVGLAPIALTTSVLGALAAGLVAAFLYSLAGQVTPRWFAGVSPYAVAYASLIPAALALAPLAAMNVPPVSAFTTPVTIAVLFLGFITTGLAYFLYFRILEKLGPVRTSAVAFLIPLFALVWGRLFLGEPITTANIIGGGLVLLGVAFVQGLFERKSPA